MKKDISVIVDNQDRRVGKFLYDSIQENADLSIVSAYFTIYAFEHLREKLKLAKRVRFLYGDPSALMTLDPYNSEGKPFHLTEDGHLDLKKTLFQKPLARECADWIQEKVDIRTIKDTNLLHGKMYHISQEKKTTALVGSSNLTRRGLGYGGKPNIELNLEINDQKQQAEMLNWFNQIWSDDELTRDAKEDVLAALNRLGKNYSPQFVYFKTLYHSLYKQYNREIQAAGFLTEDDWQKTSIWTKLFKFQQQGATSAINRLKRYNGCIIADSVGLGKTWTALAVIKYFQRDGQVLVLCPSRLKENWLQYTAYAGAKDNPFSEDRFDYTVLAHTDLSRDHGKAGVVDLSNFNWSNFGLVVIDESHNFRNEGQDKHDENGNLIKRSRYKRLLEEVLKQGVRTKVLMLSATPINTSLKDLRNQVYLMTEGRQDSFREELQINNLQELFANAQKAFQKWEDNRLENQRTNKAELLEALGGDFLSLLDTVSLARSRKHIKQYYPDVIERFGSFPQREKPKNLYPNTDKLNRLSYIEICQRIREISFAVYSPSRYLKNTESSNQGGQNEHFLIGLMQINFLKRLESSVYALASTLERTIKKMEEVDKKIERHRRDGLAEEVRIKPDDLEDDEEMLIDDVKGYRLDKIDIDQWQLHLQQDLISLNNLYQSVGEITPERDMKLDTLKDELRKKVMNPTQDKDGRKNRKALIFTSFADTANYLYTQLKNWAIEELKVDIALVTGGGGNQSSVGTIKFNDILSHFAPKAKGLGDQKYEIDILIATDCLSEGQNLQDCDHVINYDIHWNPVRLMQRFGRIDRLGSKNHTIRMTNFWPTKDLDQYLKLINRVESRMALTDATGTGLDDPINQESVTQEANFRDRQLRRIQSETLDIEDTDDAIGLNDLTLDDFVADLLNFVEQNKDALERAPMGIYANVENGTAQSENIKIAKPGVIFCLKHNGDFKERTPNRLWPYFLVYVCDDGSVRYTFQQTHHCLTLFRHLASGISEPLVKLEDAFDWETSHGRNAGKYERLLGEALSSIRQSFKRAVLDSLFNSGSGIIPKATPESESGNEFTLVTWLIIRDHHLEN